MCKQVLQILLLHSSGVENIADHGTNGPENILCWQKEKREGRKRGKEKKEGKERKEGKGKKEKRKDRKRIERKSE